MSSRQQKRHKMAAHFGWRNWKWEIPQLTQLMRELAYSPPKLSMFRQRAVLRKGEEITFAWIDESREMR